MALWEFTTGGEEDRDRQSKDTQSVQDFQSQVSDKTQAYVKIYKNIHEKTKELKGAIVSQKSAIMSKKRKKFNPIKAGLFECSFFWGESQFDAPPIPIFHISKRTNPKSI